MSGSGPVAALPMYALQGMEPVNEALWAAIRTALEAEGIRDLPAHLAPTVLALPAAIAPETVFSQMCGYPLLRHYAGQYRILGTPRYDLPGCGLRRDGLPTHCAFILVSRASAAREIADLRGSRFAVNGFDSNSGMNLPRRLFAPFAEGGSFFSSVTVSGGHLRSMEAVAAGEADAASIDCVTYGFAGTYRPALVDELRILAETPISPAIPFITAAATPPETAAALTRALTESPGVRAALAALHIAAVVPPRPEAYEAVLAFETEASALGYPVLS